MMHHHHHHNHQLHRHQSLKATTNGAGLPSNLIISGPTNLIHYNNNNNNNNNFSIRSNISTQTNNAPHNSTLSSQSSKKMSKILYGNCLSPITNSTDSLASCMNTKTIITDETPPSSNKKYFFKKFKTKRSNTIATATASSSSSTISNSMPKTAAAPQEKLKLHLSRESLNDKDLAQEEDLIDLDPESELDVTISYSKTTPVAVSLQQHQKPTPAPAVMTQQPKQQHTGSSSTLNDSQFSFNEATLSSVSSSTSSPQPALLVTIPAAIMHINENDHENDADIDDNSLNSISNNNLDSICVQTASMKYKLRTMPIATAKTIQPATVRHKSKTPLISKLYYDNIPMRSYDELEETNYVNSKYFSESDRSATAFSNYDNCVSEYESNEYLTNTINYLSATPSAIATTKCAAVTSSNEATTTTTTTDYSGKSLSITPTSTHFPLVTSSSSNSSSSSCASSSSGGGGGTTHNSIPKIVYYNQNTINNIYGCVCPLCTYNAFLRDRSLNAHTSMMNGGDSSNVKLTFNALSIKQIIFLKKHSLSKLTELLQKYLSPISLSKIKLSSNYDKTSRFYSFRSFNSHNTTSNVMKEKQQQQQRFNTGSPSTAHSYTSTQAQSNSHSSSFSYGTSYKNVTNKANATTTATTAGYRIFGLSLITHYQKCGTALPNIILNAMNIIESNSKELTGIFRKPGVKTRIEEIHRLIDKNYSFKFIINESVAAAAGESLNTLISYSINNEIPQVNNKIDLFDLADLVKQFFRELPECILTNNFSQVFLSIYSAEFPEHERFQAMQYAILLMPDENREAVYTLLSFLNSVAANKENNSMNATNLATCFVPSIFNLNIMKISQHKENTILSSMFSPKRLRKQMCILPDHKDMEEQRTAIHCFADMILKYKELFEVSNDLIEKYHLNREEAREQILDLQKILTRHDDTYKVYIKKCLEELLRESKDRAKGWVSKLFESGIEVFSKKLNDSDSGDVDAENDSVPLKLFKCVMEVDGVHIDRCRKILHERHIWDKTIDQFDEIYNLNADTGIVRYTLKSMRPHLNREICEFRSWKYESQKQKYALITTSINNVQSLLPTTQIPCVHYHTIKADSYYGHFLVEPISHSKLRIVYLNRVDLMGKSLKWYSSIYPHILHQTMKQLKDYFTYLKYQNIETKI